MKKSILLKLLIATLVIVFAIAGLTACDFSSDSGYTVTYQDGETVLMTESVEAGGTIKNYTPTKDDCDFVGWYTNADLSTESAFNTDSEINEDTTLYAKFAKKSISIVVRPENGSDAYKISVTKDESYSITEPTREGYTFVKFTYLDDNYVEQTFSTSGIYTFTENTTITAKWQINTYTVTFHDGDEVISTEEVQHNYKVTFPLPTKTGYKFNGWFLDGAENAFTDSTEVTSNIDLYAKYTAKKYTISFDTTGGSAIDTMEVTFGETFTLSEPTQTGYTFAGYTLNSKAFDATKAYQYDSDITLTATWTINTYKVTFHDGDNAPETQEVNYKAKADLPTKEKTGHTFDGWFLDGSEDKFLSTTPVTADIDLYSKYSANTYTIHFYSEGGIVIEDKTVTYGECFTLVAPNRTGYTFTGYTLNNVQFDETKAYNYVNDITLVVKWTINTYTVTFHDGESETEQEVNYNATATLPTKEKTGHTFNGWFLQGSEEKFLPTTPIIGDIDLYSKYTANTYTIYFYTNGGNAIADKTVTYGETYTVDTPTKAGYDFTGYTLRDGSIFDSSKPYTNVDNTTLYATWAIKSYSVTFKKADDSVYGTAQTITYNTYATAPTAENGYSIKIYDNKEFTGNEIVVATTPITDDTVWYVNIIPNQYTITVINYDSATCTVDYGTTYTLPESPMKEGEWSSFDGYKFGSATGTEFAYTGTYSWTNDIIVYATYTKNPMYLKSTVTCMDGSKSLGSVVVDDGSTVTLTTINTAKTGYDFVGWYTKSDFSVAFDDETAISDDTTLYAKYTAKSYKITIDLDGGDGTEEIAVTYDASFDLPADPTKDYYTFVEYVDGTGKKYVKPETYTVDGDSAIKATWKRNQVKVTFNNGNGASDTIVDVDQHDALTNYVPKDPTKTGYTFNYWTANGTDEFDAATLIDVAMTLNAKYTANSYKITIDLDGGDGTEEIAVTYDASFDLPTDPTKDYYTFVEYVDGTGKKYVKPETYTVDGDSAIKATWKRNQVKVTFNNGNGASDTIVDVDQHDALTNYVPKDPTKTGYTFNYWTANGTDEFDVATLIDADMTLTAKYTANSYVIIIDLDGGTGDSSVDVTYDAAFTLPTLTKSGYTFVKFVDKDGNSYDKPEKYNVAGNTNIKATWERNVIKVTFKDNTGSIFVDVDENDVLKSTSKSYLPADPTKTGYTFSFWAKEGESTKYNYLTPVTEAITLVAIFDANEYTITLDYGDNDTRTITVDYDATYELPEAPEKIGNVFKKYQKDGVDFARTGTYEYAENITVTIVWEAYNGERNKYFLEKATASDEGTYVFLTGVTYAFEDYTISTTDGSSYITITDDHHFVATNTGSFTITFTANEIPTTRQAKVVNYVNSVAMGSNYTTMLAGATESNYQSLDDKGIIDAGVSDFIPEINVIGDSSRVLTLENSDMIVSVYNVTDSETVASDKYTLEDNVLSFNASLIGKKVTVTFTPKYALSANNIEAVTMTLNLNEGVNVYTSSELRAAYGDSTVQKINILRNITATLLSSDYDTTRGGHGYQTEDITLKDGTVLTGVDTGTPFNDYAHGAYTRTTENKDDNLVVNGNFFTIDGTKLPYIDNTHDKYGADGSEYTVGAGYRIANVQIGIFLYRCAKIKAEDYTSSYYGIADGNVSFNNLQVEGNSYFTYSDKTQDLGDGDDPLLKMSAGYIGFVVRGGTVNMDNVTVRNTSMGVLMDGGVSGHNKPGNNGVDTQGVHVDGETQASQINLTSCIIEKNWANSIYCYDLCKVTATNTKFGSSCGAIFAFDDRPYSDDGQTATSCGYSQLNSALILDKYTAANSVNWVSGAEAWFVAYGMNGIATQLKAGVESGVSAVGYTILKTEGETTKMNFFMFTKPTGTVSDYTQYDKDGSVALDSQTYQYQNLGSGNSIELFYYDTAEMYSLQTEPGRPYFRTKTSAGTYDVIIMLPMYLASEEK